MKSILIVVILSSFCIFSFGQAEETGGFGTSAIDTSANPIDSIPIVVNDTNVITSTGNVGIGTENPTHKLEVVGNSKLSGTVTIDSSMVIGKEMEVLETSYIREDLVVDGDLILSSWEDENANFFRPVYSDRNGYLLFEDPEPEGRCPNGGSIPLWNHHCDLWTGDPEIRVKVGINTNQPSTELEVVGSVLVRDYFSLGTDALSSGAQFYNEGTTYLHSRLGIGIANNSFQGTERPAQVVSKVSDSNDISFFSRYQSPEGNIKRNLYLIPNLADNGYNPIAQTGDIGLVWTDLGNTTTGENSNSGLVITPHSNALDKGIRISADGNVSICTNVNSANDRLVIQSTSEATGNFLKLLSPQGLTKLLIKNTGKIYATEVEIRLDSPLGDFVFEESYSLMSLSELERFIKLNHHLPGVPSAKEVEANGLNLGEMNNILLQKIEEITLHVIAQQKEIERLRSIIESEKN